MSSDFPQDVNKRVPAPVQAPPHDRKDAVARESMQKLAQMIDEQLPDKWGFCLLTFPLGTPGRTNYISNGKRSDVIRALRAFIKRSKQNPDDEDFYKHHPK